MHAVSTERIENLAILEEQNKLLQDILELAKLQNEVLKAQLNNAKELSQLER